MEQNANELNSAVLKDALAGLPVGDLYYYDTIGSTNDAAIELTAGDAPDMTVVTAGAQLAGRGRMQRVWVTQPGSSLPMTILIRPTETERANLNLFSPYVGLAVHEALREDYGIASEIKWPNDVLLNRRKISGILCEMRWSGDELRGLVLGIGMNLLHGSVPAIRDINYPASCVEDETGVAIPRPRWIRSFIRQLIRLRPLIGKAEFFKRWESHMAYKDERVSLIRTGGDPLPYIVRGIDSEGCLLAENMSGEIEKFIAGEISLRKA